MPTYPSQMLPRTYYVTGSKPIVGHVFFTYTEKLAETHLKDLQNHYPMVESKDVWLMTMIKQHPDWILVRKHHTGMDPFLKEPYYMTYYTVLAPDTVLFHFHKLSSITGGNHYPHSFDEEQKDRVVKPRRKRTKSTRRSRARVKKTAPAKMKKESGEAWSGDVMNDTFIQAVRDLDQKK